jgi:hypothetical protein
MLHPARPDDSLYSNFESLVRVPKHKEILWHTIKINKAQSKEIIKESFSALFVICATKAVFRSCLPCVSLSSIRPLVFEKLDEVLF